MFKLRSIAARLILAISLTVAVACGILGTFSILQQRALTQLALDQQLKLQYESVIAALDYEGRAGLAVSAVIAALPPVEEAVAKGDRDALLTLLQGAMAAIKPQGIPLISFHTPPATAFFRIHEHKAFGEDISARRKTVVESNTTGKPIVGVEPGRASLGVYAMTPIMRGGKSIGVVDIGVSFDKHFVESTKRRFGVDLAVHRFDGKAFVNIASTFGDSSLATQDELKGVFEGSTLRRDTTFGDHPAALFLGQIKKYAGQAVEVFHRNMIEARTMREAQEASKQQAELEKKALQRQMADRFEADVKSVVGAVAKATEEMQRVASDITASVNGTSERAAAAAAATDEASASVNTVAAATEELASSVTEIGRQVSHSSGVADAAVVKAEQTTKMVESLASAAEKIGEVLRLIGAIASQTNLLA